LFPASRPAAAEEKAAQSAAKLLAPPIDLDIKDIKEMKGRVEKVKPLLEKDKELTDVKVREIQYRPGVVPRIHLAHGYGTVIVLPYQVEASNIALGDREKFRVEVKGTSVVIFPLQEFKTTNMVVFETVPGGDLVPHHYMLVENSQAGVADLTVRVHKPKVGDETDPNGAIMKALMTRRIPGKESYEGMFFEGRSPVVNDMTQFPFLRKLSLVSPDLNVYLIDGKYIPVGDVEWSVYLDGKTTVVATRAKSLTVKRASDGKTFTGN